MLMLENPCFFNTELKILINNFFFSVSCTYFFIKLRSNNYFVCTWINEETYLFFTRSFGGAHYLMYKKSNPFAKIFVVNYEFFLNKSVRKSPIKRKIDMLYQMNNTYRITVFRYLSLRL